MESQYKRYAFISYNHKDVAWADWLRKQLENYKLPENIENEFIDSRFLRPVFRDKDDLSAGILGEELRIHLETSKYLIVICSPNSAKSMWVSSEVNYFIKHDRLQNIIPFIVSGEPNTGDKRECFPLSLREFVKNNPEQELLGVNVQEVGKQKAVVRVASRILGVDFDSLWKRHERAKRRKSTLVSVITVLTVLFLSFFITPVQMFVKITDQQHSLPMPEQMVLTVNGNEYPLTSSDTMIEVSSLPGYYRGRTIPLSFTANYYNTIQTSEKIPLSIENTIEINLLRDSTFAIFAGVVVDENGYPLENVVVDCENSSTTTDENGYFYISFPLKQQSSTKSIHLSRQGYFDAGRMDESPNVNLYYLMRKKSEK